MIKYIRVLVSREVSFVKSRIPSQYPYDLKVEAKSQSQSWLVVILIELRRHSAPMYCSASHSYLEHNHKMR